jgi:hypothetical protein
MNTLKTSAKLVSGLTGLTIAGYSGGIYFLE